MAEMTTSTFERMGDDGIPNSVINMSGQRSPYTKLVPKKGPTNIGPDSVGGHAGQMLIGGEVQGPKFAPQTVLPGGAQSPEASQTGRNLRLMPSATGVSDFWAKRSEGGKI